jgi:uncharacterized membrane protein
MYFWVTAGVGLTVIAAVAALGLYARIRRFTIRITCGLLAAGLVWVAVKAVRENLQQKAVRTVATQSSSHQMKLSHALPPG